MSVINTILHIDLGSAVPCVAMNVCVNDKCKSYLYYPFASNNLNEGVSYNYTTLLSLFFYGSRILIITNIVTWALRAGQYFKYMLFNVILDINKIMNKIQF